MPKTTDVEEIPGSTAQAPVFACLPQVLAHTASANPDLPGRWVLMTFRTLEIAKKNNFPPVGLAFLVIEDP